MRPSKALLSPVPESGAKSGASVLVPEIEQALGNSLAQEWKARLQHCGP